MVDPIDQVQEIVDDLKKVNGLDVWHHIDAAYGGYFCTLKTNSILPQDTQRALEAFSRVDSITIDPHKLGYVPYACGAVFFRQKRNYNLSSVVAPYVQFDTGKDKGPFSIEGSRSATGACATWMTHKCVGFNEEGYGRILAKTITSASSLKQELQNVFKDSIHIFSGSGLNVFAFALIRPTGHLSEMNNLQSTLFAQLAANSENPFFVTKTKLSLSVYRKALNPLFQRHKIIEDADHLTLVRICLMNPFFGSKHSNLDYAREFVATLRELAKILPA